MTDTQKILIVDDNASVSELISLYLTREFYDTRIVTNGEQALVAFAEYHPDLILLDRLIPCMDGYQVCREIRAKSDVPIIMLYEEDEVIDRVLGFDLGADDYINKPFDAREMVARIKAILRRCQPVKAESPTVPTEKQKSVEYPGLSVNLSNYLVVCNGHSIDMTPKELELLYFLASSPNRVFNREQLLDNIWGYEYEGNTRTVDVHVKRLREKLGNGPNWEITTVRGIGYKFRVE